VKRKVSNQNHSFMKKKEKRENLVRIFENLVGALSWILRWSCVDWS